MALSGRGGLWKFALVYVPESCKERVDSCRIHVNYHGALVIGVLQSLDRQSHGVLQNLFEEELQQTDL